MPLVLVIIVNNLMFFKTEVVDFFMVRERVSKHPQPVL